MPGTFVRDGALAALITSNTYTSTQTGAAVQVGRPGSCRIKLAVTGVVSGTTPTLDVEIQAADASDFSGTVVKLGKFAQVTATLGTTAHFLQVDCQKTYIRAVATIAGTTPSFGGTAVTVEERRYQRTAADTA